MPVVGSGRNAWRSKKRRGVRSQSSDSTWRRTMARKRGLPFAGGSVSGGIAIPASNRSRAVVTMPPQSPVEASPIPMTRGSNGPNVTVGPDGQRLANRKP